jgi:hypothetical protein
MHYDYDYDNDKIQDTKSVLYILIFKFDNVHGLFYKMFPRSSFSELNLGSCPI